MVQLEAGSAFWNSSRPIGSQASGLTGRSRAISGLNMRAKNSERPIKTPAECPPAPPGRSPPPRAAGRPARSSRCPCHWARPDRTDRQTGSAPSPACSAAWESLCYASPPAARPAAAHPAPTAGQQALGELTQPARDGRRGAPDLHRRQDNHFARRVVHADDRLLTLCLLHLMPPYVE